MSWFVVASFVDQAVRQAPVPAPRQAPSAGVVSELTPIEAYKAARAEALQVLRSESSATDWKGVWSAQALALSTSVEQKRVELWKVVSGTHQPSQPNEQMPLKVLGANSMLFDASVRVLHLRLALWRLSDQLLFSSLQSLQPQTHDLKFQVAAPDTTGGSRRRSSTAA
jgi:hypothetical protein